MQDETQLLLGTTRSSDRPGNTTYSSDPATFKAGLAVRLGSDGLLTLTKGSNQWAGISLGKSLSDISKTTVLRLGSAVPVRLALLRSSATVTITSFANLVSGTDDILTINGTAFTAQAGAATPGDATFQADASNEDTATSLATQVNAHATIGNVVRATVSGAVVTLTAIVQGEDGDEITLTYTDNDTNVGLTLGNANGGHLNGGSDDPDDIDYVTLGTKAYVDDETGEFTANTYQTTISDAVYVAGLNGQTIFTGIDEDGSEVPCALVDVIGGL